MYSLFTRQLLMGAGHCPWGEFTDWNVCNIYGCVCLASRYHAMLRPRTFCRFGTLPATLPPCQYSWIVLKETLCRPTTFGKIPNIVGMLPKVPHLSPISHNWPHTYLCDHNWPRKGTFSWIFDSDRWPLTLGHRKISLLSRLKSFFMPNMEVIGQTVVFCGRLKELVVMCLSQMLQRKL